MVDSEGALTFLLIALINKESDSIIFSGYFFPSTVTGSLGTTAWPLGTEGSCGHTEQLSRAADKWQPYTMRVSRGPESPIL
jgi:hypothetical protein